MVEKKCSCQGICVTSPATNSKLSKSTLLRRAWRIISSEMSIPTTRPSGTNFAKRRDSHPAPQPTSRTLSVGASCIFSSTGSVMGRWSCSIPSPRPASAQRLNSSRSVSSDGDFVTGLLREGVRYTALPHALQKRAPGNESAPHWLQKRPALTGTILTGTYLSPEQAQINAINQPMTVQPKSKFTMKMPTESELCRPIMAGRKYRSAESIINVQDSPLSASAQLTETPLLALP